MTGLSINAQNTVKAIVNALENNDIPYVIARNYENYPDFGHDLDLFYSSSKPVFDDIAMTVAAECGWDVVTYCDHWSKSPVFEHNIDVYRFYTFDSNEYLQVDLFKGFLVWGIPLVSSDEVLRNRELHSSGLFYKPNISIENIFRLLQINSLIGNECDVKKVERYRDRVLKYCEIGSESLLEYGKKFGLIYIKESLGSLSMNDLNQFRFYMNKSKKNFFIKCFYNDPILSLRQLFSRVVEYYRLFHSSPCGSEISVYVQYENQKNMVKGELNRLIDTNFILCWSELKSKHTYSLKERKVLERSGVLVKWVNYVSGDAICLGRDESGDEIFVKLRDYIIFRHEVVYKKK